MNTKEYIEELIRKAESGDSDAQNGLGVAFHNGDGVERDYQKAREWYLKAAEQNNMYALSNLGKLYKNAFGVEKDLNKAFEYFLKAAELGHPSSMETVAMAYDYGNGVTKNAFKAVQWYQKAANKGLRVSQNNLGAKYKSGIGIEKDFYKAYEWYSKSAKQGEEYAQCNLGICYEEGEGVQKDLKKAVFWYSKSSKQGHDRANKRLKALLEKYDVNIDRVVLSFQELTENPFRILGAYSNASIREITANKSKLAVFAKIGKNLELPIDKLISNCYVQKYPLQQTLFDNNDVEDERTVASLYNRIQYIPNRLETLRSSEFFSEYDETDLNQTYRHNEIVEEISELQNELEHLYVAYESKVKEMFSIVRNIDAMDNAIVSINQPIDKIRHALFWFINVTPIDEIAINNFAQGNTAKAIEILDKDETFSSLINRGTIALINEDFNAFIRCITKVIHNDDYRNAFCKTVCGENFSIQEEELAHTFIGLLLKELPNEDWKSVFYDDGVSADDDDFVCTTLAKVPSDKLLEKTAEVAAISRDKGLERYNAAVLLMNLAKNELKKLESLVEINSLQYQTVADKVARELLNSSIDYYNKCSDTIYLATKQTTVMNQYAFDIAIGTTLKERAKGCLNQVKDKLKKMPPATAFALFGKVNSMIADFSKKPDLIIHSEKLLTECAPLITEIKEILGRDNEAYRDISTNVVANALINIIAEVNATFEKVNKVLEDAKSADIVRKMSANPTAAFESLISVLKKCWQLFINMDLYDLEADFQKDRYMENRKIIQKHLSDFKISTYGFSPTISMRTETDIYNSCNSILSFTNYIKSFPNGKYRLEADKQISKLKAEDDAYWNDCQRKNDFSRYLGKYRNGLHAREANAEIYKLKKIKDENYWAACCKTGDYEAYLSSYKDGLHAKEATAFIEKKKATRRRLKWCAILLAIFIGIALIWGADGFIFMTGAIAFLGFCGFAGKGDLDCGTRITCLIIGGISGLICYALCQMFGR